MGITRSSFHKRRATGGKKKSMHKKRKFELARPVSNTKLSTESNVHQVRVRGGNIKKRALALNIGNFAWCSEAQAHKTRVVDVVYNSSNNELTRTKTLVKGCVVVIDAAPFKEWYEDYYNETLGRTKEDKIEAGKLSKEQRALIKKHREAHQEVEETMREQFQTGRVLAKLTSRPGQVGRADGYILEGPELLFYMKKIQQKKQKK